MRKFLMMFVSMAAQKCRTCGHLRTAHTKFGCSCGCDVKYMDKDMFEQALLVTQGLADIVQWQNDFASGAECSGCLFLEIRARREGKINLGSIPSIRTLGSFKGGMYGS